MRFCFQKLAKASSTKIVPAEGEENLLSDRVSKFSVHKPQSSGTGLERLRAAARGTVQVPGALAASALALFCEPPRDHIPHVSGISLLVRFYQKTAAKSKHISSPRMETEAWIKVNSAQSTEPQRLGVMNQMSLPIPQASETPDF